MSQIHVGVPDSGIALVMKKNGRPIRPEFTRFKLIRYHVIID